MWIKKISALLLALVMAFGVITVPASAADAQAEASAAAAEAAACVQVFDASELTTQDTVGSLVLQLMDLVSLNDLISLALKLPIIIIYTLDTILSKDYAIGNESKLVFAACMGGQRWTLSQDITVSDTVKVTAVKELKIDAQGHSISKNNEGNSDPIFSVTKGSRLQISNMRLAAQKGSCIVNAGQTNLVGGTVVTTADPGSFAIRNVGQASLGLYDMSCNTIHNEGALVMLTGYQADVAEVVSERGSHILMFAGHIGTLRTPPGELNSILTLIDGTIDRYETVQLFGFAWPLTVRGYISSPYGYRTNPVTGAQQFHSGVDISAAGINGKPVLAAESGTVILAENKSTYGNCVMISHNETYVTLYAHCSELYVKAGDTVTRGQTIAAVGATGNATGPHLHFEVRENGVTVDPMNFITMPDA